VTQVNLASLFAKRITVQGITISHLLYWAWVPQAWSWLNPRLSIPFRSIRNGRNIPYQFKKRNKTKQISSHFKSRSVPDFSAKFRPERSGSIPHVPFRSWKAIELNWIKLNLIQFN
jgi:hypothetical protein